MSDSGRLSEKVAFKWRSEEAITLAKRMAGGRTFQAEGQPVQGDSQCRGLRGECAGVLQGLRGGQGSRSTGSHTEWGMRSERHRKASRTHG